MKHSAFLTLVFSVAVCAVGHAQTVETNTGKPRAVRPEGTEAFRNILHYFRLQPVKRIQELQQLDPAETLIVVFGENKVLMKIHAAVGGLKEFEKQGGAVLVATDHDSGAGLEEWRLTVTGASVVDPRRGYRGFESCPRIEATTKAPRPLFEGIRDAGVVTNHPSFLEGRGRARRTGLVVAARFGPGSTPLNEEKIPQPYMVASRDSQGVLILAGHGVFMNMLLAQVDNDNMTFAFNCVRWLSQGPGGKRKHALFVENGTIVDEFDLGLTGPPSAPLPPTQILNRMIRGLEKENFFNRLLGEFVTHDRILRTALLLCSVVLVLYGGWRLIGARQRNAAAVPLAGGNPASGAEPTVLTQRRNAMTEQGNFAEAAAGLVRGFFAEYAPPAARAPFAHQSRVPFHAEGGWLGRALLIRQVNYLWRIATEDAGAVSARQLQRLPPLLDRVAAALQQGRLLVNSKG